MKIWIFMDTDREVGPNSIKGIYKTKEKAKVAIADYALENEECNTTYFDLFSIEIED